MTTSVLLWVICILAANAWILFMVVAKIMLTEIRLLRADHAAIKSVIEKWLFELKRKEMLKDDADA